MGILQDQEENRRGSRKKGNGQRGSTNNKARLQALGNRAKEEALWKDVEPKAIHAVVVAATMKGGAVRFGVSRDGGAFSVGVYLEGESTTLYCNGGDDVNLFLEDIFNFFVAAE